MTNRSNESKVEFSQVKQEFVESLINEFTHGLSEIIKQSMPNMDFQISMFVNGFLENLLDSPIIKHNPEYLQAISLKLRELRVLDLKPINDAISLIDKVYGNRLAEAQMQQMGAIKLLFQFEPNLHIFQNSPEVMHAKRDYLLEHTNLPVETQQKLIGCFDNSLNQAQKIQKYVELISDLSNLKHKNEARFAAEVLFEQISKKNEMLVNISPSQCETIDNATKSSTAKQTLKNIQSMAGIKKNKEEDSIQKIYREMHRGHFPTFEKSRKEMENFYDIVHKGILVGENPLAQSQEIGYSTKYAPPTPPLQTVSDSPLKVGETEASFLADIQKMRIEQETTEVKKKPDIPPPPPPIVKVGVDKVNQHKLSFLDEIQIGDEKIKEVNSEEKAKGSKVLEQIKKGVKLKKVEINETSIKAKSSGSIFDHVRENITKNRRFLKPMTDSSDSSDSSDSDDDKDSSPKKINK